MHPSKMCGKAHCVSAMQPWKQRMCQLTTKDMDNDNLVATLRGLLSYAHFVNGFHCTALTVHSSGEFFCDSKISSLESITHVYYEYMTRKKALLHTQLSKLFQNTLL